MLATFTAYEFPQLTVSQSERQIKFISLGITTTDLEVNLTDQE
jgi:hypothetical protein